MDLVIRTLEAHDIAPIAAAFHALGWHKPASQYERYLAEQSLGKREVWLALVQQQFAGYLTICWQPDYPPFKHANIPEIQDFNVLPIFRRQGIGTRLMDEAEGIIAQRSPVAGIGVGLYADYGPAQRLYVMRGYVPDGNGIFYGERLVSPGGQVIVDDDLLLFLTKDLTK
jgi:ribosomal protein S18 acetylase RimI-like enzyme